MFDLVGSCPLVPKSGWGTHFKSCFPFANWMPSAGHPAPCRPASTLLATQCPDTRCANHNTGAVAVNHASPGHGGDACCSSHCIDRCDYPWLPLGASVRSQESDTHTVTRALPEHRHVTVERAEDIRWSTGPHINEQNQPRSETWSFWSPKLSL